MPTEHILRATRQEGFLEEWIDRRTGRQAAILCSALRLNGSGSTGEKKEALREAGTTLHPYFLVDHFSQYKSKVAVVDFARGVLNEKDLQSCQKGENGESYDTAALLFAIFRRRWSDLKLIYHLDKIHKTGFARMKLQDTIRHPQQAFKEFLQFEPVKAILAEFDRERADGLSSKVKDVITHDERHLVFIRRANRPLCVVQEAGAMFHGYKPEWIILDFEESAKRVNISSDSVSIPLEIANRIASGYFGKTCEYANEREVTFAKQVEYFLSRIRDAKDGDLLLVEVVAANSPLEGAPKLKISDPGSCSIGSAIGHFEKVVGKLLTEIVHIESVKVLFHAKRVSLIFDKEGDQEFVVRYSDHRLNARERREFEKLMKETLWHRGTLHRKAV